MATKTSKLNNRKHLSSRETSASGRALFAISFAISIVLFRVSGTEIEQRESSGPRRFTRQFTILVSHVCATFPRDSGKYKKCFRQRNKGLTIAALIRASLLLPPSSRRRSYARPIYRRPFAGPQPYRSATVTASASPSDDRYKTEQRLYTIDLVHYRTDRVAARN